MKKVTIQFQYENDDLLTQTCKQMLTVFANSFFTTGMKQTDNKEECYLNVTYDVLDLKAFWDLAKTQWLCDENEAQRLLADSLIVVAEGEHSWDDYVILYHFDKTVDVDKMME